jgi:hypothetical protein
MDLDTTPQIDQLDAPPGAIGPQDAEARPRNQSGGARHWQHREVLVAEEGVESSNRMAAIGRARTLAQGKAGAVAFSRTGDPELGEFDPAEVACNVRRGTGRSIGALS